MCERNRGVDSDMCQWEYTSQGQLCTRPWYAGTGK